MSAQSTADSNDDSQAVLLAELDKICDRFEAAWCNGENPRIEDSLAGVDEPLRSRLLRELVALEVAYRREQGQTPNFAEYEVRFAADTDTVWEAFRSRGRVECSSELAETAKLTGSPTPPGRLEIRCPNCRAVMQVAVDTSLTELTCSSCGSHFSLVDQRERTQAAPPLSKLGRFELIERLGVGGFGSVWKARDKELDRTVAIKIPRRGAMTAEEQERFLHEARAAAQLRHPHIVSVYEIGREDDSIYIVCDFVRGVTLSDWLTGQQLTGREAANLCAQIAAALHYAHEQGVIHRDLKPANIMIDGDGEPHLMDFGLARRNVGEVTVTLDGQILGTPAYMSPEQAQGEAHQADRRSDVYSLGVILFQLLTGELPFRGNARMLMHQVIHDEPPSPRKLNAHVAKDLETITLKCLEKDPERRYATAGDVAAELRRFLRGESIEARPLGMFTKTLRWTKRKPMAALVAVMVVGLAIVGPLVAVHQSQLAFGERIARKQAASEAAKATAISGLFQESLQSANPDAAKGADYTVRQLLDDISARLGSQLQDQQEIEAAIRTTIGNAYRRLDLLDDAESQLNEAMRLRRLVFAPDDPEMASNLFASAWLAYERKDLVACETLVREALAIHHKHNLQNDETIEILSLLNLLLVGQKRISEAEQVAQEVRTLTQQLPDPHPELANVLHRSILYLIDKGDLEQAEAIGRESVALHKELHGAHHPETAWGLASLGAALMNRGKLDEAEECCRESLAIFREYHDDSHIANRSAIYWLKRVLRLKDDQAELAEVRSAELLNTDEAITRAESQLKTVRSRKASLLNDAAWDLLTRSTARLEDVEQALTFAKEAIALTEAQDGSPPPDYLDTLALAQHLAGATFDAVKTQELAVSLLSDKPDSSQAEYYTRLIQYYEAAGKEQDAVALASDFTDKVIAAYRDSPSNAAIILALCAHSALAEHLAAPAEVLARKCFQLRSELFPDDHHEVWLRHNAASMFGEALALQGRFAEAEPLLLEAAEWMTSDARMPSIEETNGEDHALEAVQRVVQLYESWHKAEPDAGHDEEARRWLKR